MAIKDILKYNNIDKIAEIRSQYEKDLKDFDNVIVMKKRNIRKNKRASKFRKLKLLFDVKKQYRLTY